MIVAGDDTGKGIAKHFTQHFGAATGRDMKEDGSRSDKSPEITSFAFVFPAGFIDVEGQGRSGIPFDGTDHRQTGLGDTFGSIADGAGGDGEYQRAIA